MAEASDFPSVREFKEHLINNLAHVIAGVHCGRLQHTCDLLGGLYNEVDMYLARTGHVRRELFPPFPQGALLSQVYRNRQGELPRGGLFTRQQAEVTDQQTCELNPCNEVDAWRVQNHPSEVLSVKIEDATSVDQRYTPVCSPISDASTESDDVYLPYVLSDPEDSQVLSDPEDLSQQIATDTPLNMAECNESYIAMLKNYADEWGFSLQKEFATDNIL